MAVSPVRRPAAGPLGLRTGREVGEPLRAGGAGLRDTRGLLSVGRRRGQLSGEKTDLIRRRRLLILSPLLLGPHLLGEEASMVAPVGTPFAALVQLTVRVAGDSPAQEPAQGGAGQFSPSTRTGQEVVRPQTVLL